ncbi:MAG: bifunctional diguanylate cyclase/phosphodiesterase [Cypionkella sp.]|nr:bifunctional diguanylate cyclase/phosphodiesterase [Cypionkella sp.]
MLLPSLPRLPALARLAPLKRLWTLRLMLRRPEIMAFLPALTLAAFWFGGEQMLVLTALGLPLLFVLAGAFREEAEVPAFPDGVGGFSSLGQIERSLTEVLQTAPFTAETTGVLTIMIDNLADYEASYGNAAMTALQERLADRLISALRGPDMIARLRQGCFVVMLAPMRRLDLEAMVQVAARLQSAVAPTISLDAARLYVTASVGFCLAGRAAQNTARGLIDAASAAGLDALRCGPGAIRAYSPEIAARLQQTEDLRASLERAFDEGQIQPWFQPQISTDTGALTGLEALARWVHPTRGVIPPADFLPAVMDAGLAPRLCDTMLASALAALRKWDQAGIRIPRVAVNFSDSELRDPRLVDRIKWELDRFDLRPDRLCIEILETVVADSTADIISRNLAGLTRLGCPLDLDDFGTGHASLASIRRFGVGRIKIDRSFVTHVHEDREQQRTIAAILSMAEQLGLETLAEGVELQEEHNMLAQLGCKHVQGYVIARPMAFDDVVPWLTHYRATLRPLPRIGSRAL